ncbi:MAG: ATP-binding protein [Burkholderiaceae bacterium]
MKNDPKKPIDMPMRRRAEATLKQQAKLRSLSMTDYEVRKQYHELQVSQIELEMQNNALNELQHARLEIEAGLKRYTELFDFAPVGYVSLDRVGTLSDINLTSAQLLGLERERLIGRQLGFFISQDSQQIFKNFLANVFDHGTKGSCEVELMQYDGSRFFAQIDAVADKQRLVCHAVLKDITQRKIAEEAVIKAHEQLEARVLERTSDLVYANEQLKLEIEERKRVEEELRQSKEQLRQLTIHQESVKEGERKRIAREIHDDLGQNLLALRIDVSIFHARTAHAHPKLHERAGATLQIIDSTMKSIRAIINNLRPSTLDIGLQAAIEWQVKEFERRSGISCKLTVNQKNIDLSLDDQIATGIFRIVQESLTNVSRHANASQVNIKLQRDKESLFLQVIDNGVGIPQGCRRKANSFGLIGMQERISQMGGELTVANIEEGAGTALTVSIPLASTGND